MATLVIARLTFREAARRIISKYIQGFEAYNTENIPQEGPLLITSNHPGTIDSLVISASVPRPALKIIATGIPFIHGLTPNGHQHTGTGIAGGSMCKV